MIGFIPGCEASEIEKKSFFITYSENNSDNSAGSTVVEQKYENWINLEKTNFLMQSDYYRTLINSASFSLPGLHLAKIETELSEFRTYKENWDGYGAKPFDTELLDEVTRLSSLLKFFEEIHLIKLRDAYSGPASDGSVDITLVSESKKLIIILYPGAEKFEIHKYDSKQVFPSQKISKNLLGKELLWFNAS
ncbi:MAG: hypothetical protein J0L62_15275 [Bacteroidetes bacterium]|nr:hypothetical protein [Bacteroidota bacterium]